MRPILIIADLRGRNLESTLYGLTDFEVKVAVYPGADILTSIDKAGSLLCPGHGRKYTFSPEFVT